MDLNKGELRVVYDVNAMDDPDRMDMDQRIKELVGDFGWSFTGSGCEINVAAGKTRVRDLCFRMPEPVHKEGE